MQRTLILLTITGFLCLGAFIQHIHVRENHGELKGIFGVRVSFQTNSELLTFIAYTDNGYTRSNVRLLSEKEFILFASGTWPSVYNPKRINYFDEWKLGCGTVPDSFTGKPVTYCNPCINLWKIRFSTYPISGSAEKGWSNRPFRPSVRQQDFLYSNYHIFDIDRDFFIDTNLWKILRDVADSNWIVSYQSLK